MKARISRVLLAATMAAGALVAHPGWGAAATCKDTIDGATGFDITVDGENAHGRVSLPSGATDTLVVYGHGFGHTSSSWAHHLKKTTDDFGAIAVAMDYRGLINLGDTNGDGFEDSKGWNAKAGAADLVAAAKHFEADCGIDTIIIAGVSMGGNMTGLALASRPTRADGSPLFDYWVNVEGASNVIETYFEARALAPANGTAANAVADIETETGGKFEEVPDEYRKISVVARSADVAASGVKGAVVIHGIDDGLVPHNQAREISAALLAQGVSIDFYTVGRRDSQTERETTITGYAGDQIFPRSGLGDWVSPLAGHASEKSTTHMNMRLMFTKIADLLLGDTPSGYREYHVDGEAGTIG